MKRIFFAPVLVLFLFTLETLAGSPLSGMEVRLLNGGVTVLDRLAGPAGIVLITREANCPISERSGPRIKELEDIYAPKGFRFVYLYVGQVDTAANASGDRAKFNFKGPYIVDADLSVAKNLEIKTTTEALVFDKTGKLMYRGAVDDQHFIGGTRTRVQKYLERALDSLLQGRPIETAKTEAPGCRVNYSTNQTKPATLTFNQDIYPILERRCVNCHRTNLNFIDLTEYNSVRGRSKMIQYVIEKKLMPPWNVKSESPQFVNDLSLQKTEKEKLMKWLRSDMPEGTGPKLSTIRWTDSWRLGNPDIVVKIPKPVKVPASGIMPYQHFVVDSPFKEDIWVNGYEILTLPKVVHHIVFHVLKDGNDTDPNHFYTNFVSRFGWAQGSAGTIFPHNVGTKIPAGSKIAITIHYQPSGQETVDDQTQLGLHLYKGTPQYQRQEWSLIEDKFVIPAHATSHPVVSKMKIEKDAFLMAVTTHMHLRGQKSKLVLTSPQGKKENLLSVDPYNFNHQFLYELKTFKPLKKGSVVECTNHYNNSKDNPSNPDPDKEVRWGEQTGDEMFLCNLFVYLPL